MHTFLFRHTSSFLLMFCAHLVCNAQTGKVYDNLSMASKILKVDRKYAVYLPADYESSQRSYPVLYLLHGGGDDHTGWVQFGEVLHIADKSIADGTATSMIIVMPDAGTLRKGYTNDIKGEWRYEDYFFEEFIPFIEKTYRIKKEKRYRAIAGLSMGGEGTFIYALRHPEMFSSACPLSAATGPSSPETTKEYLNRRNIPFSSEADVSEFHRRNSVMELINQTADQEKKSVRWYIDCGDDDFLFEGNSLIHIALRKKEIPHEFRIRDGAHNWTYWRTALPDVLKFVSDAFHQS